MAPLWVDPLHFFPNACHNPGSWCVSRAVTTPEPTDESLLEHLRSADGEPFEAAFRAVYAAEKGVVYGLLLRLTGDASAAADLFQNVWLELARHRRELREDTVLRAWLCTVARREYLNHRRAQALDLSRVLTLGLEAPEATASLRTSSARTAPSEAVSRLAMISKAMVNRASPARTAVASS